MNSLIDPMTEKFRNVADESTLLQTLAREISSNFKPPAPHSFCRILSSVKTTFEDEQAERKLAREDLEGRVKPLEAERDRLNALLAHVHFGSDVEGTAAALSKLAAVELHLTLAERQITEARKPQPHDTLYSLTDVKAQELVRWRERLLVESGSLRLQLLAVTDEGMRSKLERDIADVTKARDDAYWNLLDAKKAHLISKEII